MEKQKNKPEPAKDPMPTDPSDTGGIGQNEGQGIIKIKEGLSEQSAKWDDEVQKEKIRDKEKAIENYIKHPSPEEKGGV